MTDESAQPGEDSRPSATGDPRERGPVRPLDLAVGMTNAFRPWLWGLLFAGGFIVFLLLGANQPANPTFVDTDSESAGTPGGVEFPEGKILVGASCLRVQVADTPERRAQGLKHRDTVAPYDGMIFEFDKTVQSTYFTMSEVRFPLTIGFYDQNGVRVDAQDMEPCSGSNSTCPRYGSRAPFRRALEVPKGKLPEGPLTNCPV